VRQGGRKKDQKAEKQCRLAPKTPLHAALCGKAAKLEDTTQPLARLLLINNEPMKPLALNRLILSTLLILTAARGAELKSIKR
jgi:hypothetical protein